MKRLLIFGLLAWLTHDVINQTPNTYANDFPYQEVRYLNSSVLPSGIEGPDLSQEVQFSGPCGAEKCVAF